jgi:diaminohydroxyphosphoribosylaminopyrimidine deaminase/5-amino-6-(5-phosphoribosylamino)uracil reductase
MIFAASFTASADDYRFMSRALQLAEKGRYTTRPNPCVGCVLVKEGHVIAEGWHYRSGDAHAEIHALQQLIKQPSVPAGDITAYVTLEPCAHQGRTGACALALADSDNGVVRVVYGMEDPNPLVAGRGLEILRQAGCVVDGPLLLDQAQATNKGFITRMQCDRPRVSAKIAISVDGRTAMKNGESQWITGYAARQDVQRLRARSCAVITGVDSIIHDNSRLTVRAEGSTLDNIDDVLCRPPLRVVLDSQLRLAEDEYAHAAIFDGVDDGAIDRQWRETSVVVFAAEQASEEHITLLLARYPKGVTVEKVPAVASGVNLERVLSVLAERYECNDVLLETGARLLGSFLQGQLIDELIIYQAPILMGSDARPLAAWPLNQMSEKQQLTVIDHRMIGNDVRITATLNRRGAE